MMRREKFSIANIYVPIKRRATLKPETVQEIAQSILEIGQQVPIAVFRTISTNSKTEWPSCERMVSPRIRPSNRISLRNGASLSKASLSGAEATVIVVR
jgi:hypothetical protein